MEIKNTIKSVFDESDYLLDPHGACAYKALKDGLKKGETGVFLATAHPAKFKDTVERCIGTEIEVPEALKSFMKSKKQTYPLSNDFDHLKKALINLT